MNPKLAAVLTEMGQKADEVKGIFDKAGDESLDNATRQHIITLNKEIEALEVKAIELREQEDWREKNTARLRDLKQPVNGMVHASGGSVATAEAKAAITAMAEITLGEAFVTSPEYKGWLEQVAPGGRPIGERARVQSPPVQFKSLFEQKLVTGLSDTSGGAFVYQDVKPTVNRAPFRPLVIRDVITNGTTDSDTVEFVVINSFTNNAAPVLEATSTSGGVGTKPESDMALTRDSETVKTIAHWVAVTRRALADAGQVRTIIDNFLRDGLNQELEDQIVTGDGTGENFNGILTDSGVTAQAWDTDILTTTRKARTKVRTTGRAIPTAYILNPTEWETIDLLQDNEARYFFGGPSQLGVPRLWGLPVVESEAMTQGVGVVGDMRQCVLWDRQQAQILISDSHSDFFIKNLVAILAEMRAAFGILRPAAIVEMDLTA